MAETGLRGQLNAALAEAMRAKDHRAISTLRLILAALKDRDIAARSQGADKRISDEEILQMLQSMVKQRQDAIAMYEEGGRLELAENEQAEIDVIRRFLPKQMSDDEMQAAVAETISQLGAASLKEMGKVMAELRRRYSGRMDFAKAAGVAKQHLG